MKGRFVLIQRFGERPTTPEEAREVAYCSYYHHEHGRKWWMVYSFKTEKEAKKWTRDYLWKGHWAKLYKTASAACAVADDESLGNFIFHGVGEDPPEFYYTLRGRVLKHEPYASGLCIFCGKFIRHVNEGGIGCVAGGILDGGISYFMYCNSPLCLDHLLAQNMEHGVRTCSCEGYRMHDVIGEVCHICWKEPCEPQEEQER